MNGRLYLAYRATGTGCGPETLTLKISTTTVDVCMYVCMYVCKYKL